VLFWVLGCPNTIKNKPQRGFHIPSPPPFLEWKWEHAPAARIKLGSYSRLWQLESNSLSNLITEFFVSISGSLNSADRDLITIWTESIQISASYTGVKFNRILAYSSLASGMQRFVPQSPVYVLLLSTRQKIGAKRVQGEYNRLKCASYIHKLAISFNSLHWKPGTHKKNHS